MNSLNGLKDRLPIVTNLMRTYKIMNYKGVFLFILLVLSPALLFAWEGKVVSVTDGDTIKVLKDGIQVKIRLAAIDCPEKGQPYGQAAKKFTANLVAGKSVKIWSTDTDRYGRTIAFVFVGSTDLNKELLKAGLAWHYKQYSRDPELAKLEFEARSKKVGLWKEPDQIAPWEWRRKKKTGKTKFEFSGGISTTIEH
jgi:micrococcal nuclease